MVYTAEAQLSRTIEGMRALIRVTAWERVSPWRRALSALLRVGFLIAFLIALVSVLGPPVGIFLTARMEAKKVPAVHTVVRPLTDYSVSDAPGTRLSYFGYEFEVPWSKVIKERKVGRNLVNLTVDSGHNLMMIVPANQNGLLTEMVQDQALDMRNLQPILGDLINRPAYDQYAALLSTTPRSIHAFGARLEAVRGITLLSIKAIAFGPGLESGAFSFDLPGKRGFQIGDPQKSMRVDLEVFDTAGHHVEILCSTHGHIRFSQQEINRIITSLHAESVPSPLAALQH